jgi:hypothetical protein
LPAKCEFLVEVLLASQSLSFPIDSSSALARKPRHKKRLQLKSPPSKNRPSTLPKQPRLRHTNAKQCLRCPCDPQCALQAPIRTAGCSVCRLHRAPARREFNDVPAISDSYSDGRSIRYNIVQISTSHASQGVPSRPLPPAPSPLPRPRRSPSASRRRPSCSLLCRRMQDLF